MDRLEKIRAKRQSLDAQAQKESDERAEKVVYYTKAIKALAPRLEELHKLSNECINNDIPLGKLVGYPFKQPEFISEGINHRVGFIPYDDGSVRFGIIGGGADHGDLVLNKYGEIVKNPLDRVCGLWTYERAHFDFCDKCKRFLGGFDKFEKGFLDYIDNL